MSSVKGYSILKILGSCGMAMVYLAEHKKLDKKVAIKERNHTYLFAHTIKL